MDDHPKIAEWLNNPNSLEKLCDEDPEQVIKITNLIHSSKRYSTPYLKLLPLTIKAHLYKGNHVYAAILFVSCHSIKKFYNNFYEGFFLQVLQGMVGDSEFYDNYEYPETRQLFILTKNKYLPLADSRKCVSNDILDKIVFHAEVCEENGWNSVKNNLLSSEPMLRIGVVIFDLLLNKKFAVDCLEILQNMAKTGLFWLDEWQLDITGNKKIGEKYYDEIIKSYKDNPVKMLFPQFDKSKTFLKSDKIFDLRMGVFIAMLEKYLKQWPETEYDDVLKCDIWLKPVVVRYMKIKKNHKYIPRIFSEKIENRDLTEILKYQGIEFPYSEQWWLMKKYLQHTGKSNSFSSNRLMNLFQLSFKFPSIMLLLTENKTEFKSVFDKKASFEIKYFKTLIESICSNFAYKNELINDWLVLLNGASPKLNSKLTSNNNKRKRNSLESNLNKKSKTSNNNHEILVHNENFDKTKTLTVNKMNTTSDNPLFRTVIMNHNINLNKLQNKRGFAPF